MARFHRALWRAAAGGARKWRVYGGSRISRRYSNRLLLKALTKPATTETSSELSGGQLLEALENGVCMYPKLEGRFPCVAGLSSSRFRFSAVLFRVGLVSRMVCVCTPSSKAAFLVSQVCSTKVNLLLDRTKPPTTPSSKAAFLVSQVSVVVGLGLVRFSFE
jgi:hypothetical protein